MPDINRILIAATDVPWFTAVGIPIDPPMRTIASWNDWQGPEDELVLAIHCNQQLMHDEIVADEKEEKEWQHLLSSLVALISSRVAYTDAEDSWYAPNSAVHHAAWVYGLIETYKAKGACVPAELTAQWIWFERGHWPCCLVSPGKAGLEEGYVVY
ncbi:MAG: hypothetical protein ACR2RB_08260 [Gammaproteobacteria bacterium]